MNYLCNQHLVQSILYQTFEYYSNYVLFFDDVLIDDDVLFKNYIKLYLLFLSLKHKKKIVYNIERYIVEIIVDDMMLNFKDREDNDADHDADE